MTNQVNSQALVRLTSEAYEKLLAEGYKYALITDVELNEKTNLTRQTLQFVKELPSGNKYSSTSIIDEMITSVLSNPDSDIHIYFDKELL